MSRGIPRDQSIERKILHRMKIARGHLDKVIRMTESGEYCIDVINQSQAVQSALKSIDQLILKNHMETCVSESIKNGNSNDVVEEIVKVFEKR
jgi:DNA-binding FrmR family transcriptional regulator